MATADVVVSMNQLPTPTSIARTPIDLIRDARRYVTTNHGPCAAASPWLVHVTVDRMLENASLNESARLLIFEEVTSILGTCPRSNPSANAG